MEFKFRSGQPPSHILPRSKYQPIYERIEHLLPDMWLGVDVSANDVKTVFGAINTWRRNYRADIKIKVDKNNAESGFATLWIYKEAPSDVTVRGKKSKIVRTQEIANSADPECQPFTVLEFVEA
jgi:hypothetical protein